MHKTDWKRFPPPWDKLGPKMQLEVRTEVKRIMAPFTPYSIKKQLREFVIAKDKEQK